MCIIVAVAARIRQTCGAMIGIQSEGLFLLSQLPDLPVIFGLIMTQMLTG